MRLAGKTAKSAKGKIRSGDSCMTRLRETFAVTVKAEKPIVVGQDEVNGRRQLIVCPNARCSSARLRGSQTRCASSTTLSSRVSLGGSA